MNATKPNRQQLCRWVCWFFLFNALAAFCVIFYYHNNIPNFSYIPGIATWQIALGWIYFILAFATQATLLMYFFAAICWVVAVLIPRKMIVFPIAIFFATAALFFTVGDAVTYVLYYQHYAKIGWEVYKANAFGDVLVLGGPEKLIILSLICGFFVLEYFLARAIWRAIVKRDSRSSGYIVASVLAVVVLLTYILMMGATGVTRHVVLKAARVTPYFSDVYNAVVPGSHSVEVIQTSQGPVKLQIDGSQRPLHYPLQPVQCQTPQRPLNVVLIAIDTWRFSAFNRKVTPNIYRFAQNALQFTYHYSGGNCTRPGIFTLFYSLPPNYWRAFLVQKRRPVFINELMRAGYQMGIFTSAPLTFPAFNQSVFEGIKGLVLKINGNSSIERDKKITTEFKHFLTARDPHKPFFSFLFYDAVHNYCEQQVPAKTPFKPYINECNRVTLTANTPSLPYLNRYRNAVYFDDGEVAKVLSELKRRHLLKNTIVIITSDHGEQINDEHDNVWVHASAYTNYQLQVPFVVAWPGKKARKISYFTSHYDMVPTLMRQALNCRTPFEKYSVGRSLFEPGSRPFIIVGSYGDYAVVVPNKRATRIYPNGDWQVDDMKGRPIPNASLNAPEMRTAYQMLNQFFQN